MQRVSKRTFVRRPICAHPGQIARTCRSTPTRPPMACFICGQMGNISRKCPSGLGGGLRQGLLDAGSSEGSISNQPSGNNRGTSSRSSI